MEVTEIMAEMFMDQDTWSSTEILDALREAGASTRKEHIAAAKATLGIRSIAMREAGKPGIRGWTWTVKKANAGREGDNDG
jgi:hypothetical protein